MILFMVLATLKERSNNGGYLTYGESLMTSYLTALVGIIASFVLVVILLTVDPGLKENSPKCRLMHPKECWRPWV